MSALPWIAAYIIVAVALLACGARMGWQKDYVVAASIAWPTLAPLAVIGLVVICCAQLYDWVQRVDVQGREP